MTIAQVKGVSSRGAYDPCKHSLMSFEIVCYALESGRDRKKMRPSGASALDENISAPSLPLKMESANYENISAPLPYK